MGTEEIMTLMDFARKIPTDMRERYIEKTIDAILNSKNAEKMYKGILEKAYQHPSIA